MLNVLERMDDYGLEFIPVVVDGGVIGVITRENVRSYFNLRSNLKI